MCICFSVLDAKVEQLLLHQKVKQRWRTYDALSTRFESKPFCWSSRRVKTIFSVGESSKAFPGFSHECERVSVLLELYQDFKLPVRQLAYCKFIIVGVPSRSPANSPSCCGILPFVMSQRPLTPLTGLPTTSAAWCLSRLPRHLSCLCLGGRSLLTGGPHRVLK